jgi:hypothetical protein
MIPRVCSWLLVSWALLGVAWAHGTDPETGKEPAAKAAKGDFVVVPIPISDPTMGKGLVATSAYFYPQSAQQKESQPASSTAIAALYTDNESFAYGIAQQNYWAEDRWRFNGILGSVDFNLELNSPDDNLTTSHAKWEIEGTFLQAHFARQVVKNWYVEFGGRFVDFDQQFSRDPANTEFKISANTRTAGFGLNVEYDTRDLPTNAYTGRHFEVQSLFNDESFGSDETYQSYSAAFRSYHQIANGVVVAWEAQACKKDGAVPLWDACRINLRGFPATDYMGTSSTSAQVEVRWNIWKRWGLVGFTGGGTVDRSIIETDDHELIRSNGIGLRYMVLRSKRINLRLDYARSEDKDAVYISVGEAF